jgi:hypothetical protein
MRRLNGDKQYRFLLVISHPFRITPFWNIEPPLQRSLRFRLLGDALQIRMRASLESAATPTFLPSLLHAPAQERRNESWIQEIFPSWLFPAA